MTYYKDVEKVFKRIAVEYFKKHMLGKSVEKVLYDITKELLLEIGKVIGKLEIRKYCLEIVEKDTVYAKTLLPEIREDLHNTILGLKEIINMLEEIISPILDEIEKN